MAFNKNEPSESTKIRRYPTVLTGNFIGIEEGDSTFRVDALNFKDRTVAGLAVDPTRIDDTMILYSKDDGTNTELFVLNDQNSADSIQLTEVDALGSVNTPVNAKTLSFDDTTRYDGNNFVTSYGVVNASAGNAWVHQKNMNSVSNVGGLFTLTTDAIFSNANVVVSITPTRVGSKVRIGVVSAAPTYAGNVVTITCGIVNSSGDYKTDSNFHVMVVGGM